MGRPIEYDVQKVEQYLRANAEHQTIREMAEILEISYVTVLHKLYELGLKTAKQKCKINSGKEIVVRNPAIISYIKEHIDEKTQEEMASELNITQATIARVIKLHDIHRAPAKEDDLHYFPPFEKMDAEWHDALYRILAAVMHEEDSKDGCREWRKRKDKMKTVRPPAEYNINVESAILREFLSRPGYRLKS